MNKDCIFCGIVRGDIPALKVYEDAHALVFLDVARDVDGHMLAIPKVHASSVLDCDEEMLARVMTAVRRVSRHCVENCGFEGVNLLNASGAAAGQSVPHLHIHVMPRREGDGVRLNWDYKPGDMAEIEAIYKRLKAAL